MFSYLKTGLLSILFGLVSFSLLAGEAKEKTRIPVKTKHGKAVITKNGEPVCIKAKGKK